MYGGQVYSDIEKEVQQCKICQLHHSMPSKAPLHPWEFPSRPWVRVHIDHLGPILKWQMLMP